MHPNAHLIFNPDLINDLARGRVVLFLGSGVSASASTRIGKPIRQWETFLRHAASFVSDRSIKKLIKERIDVKDYLIAAELLEQSLEHRWASILQEEFGQVAGVSDLYKVIVGLGQRIIITTNFDKLLENVWNDSAIDATHYPTVLTKLDHEVFKSLRDERNYIIKLHGTIDDNGSMIFTKSQYNKYAFGNWIYEELLRVLLLTHTFLFIGFSMNDPAISLIIEMYAQRFPDTRPHYIFLSGPVHPALIELSRKLRRLYILPYDPKNNHSELVRHIKNLGEQAKKKSAELLAQAIAAKTGGPLPIQPTKASSSKKTTPHGRRTARKRIP